MSTSLHLPTVNEWYNTFVSKRVVPPRRPADVDASPEGYTCLLTGLRLNQNRHGMLCCIQVCFFDAKQRNFFGRPYRTSFEKCINDELRLRDQFAFCCPVKGSDVNLIFEVIEAIHGNKYDLRTIAWASVPINAPFTPIVEARGLTSVGTHRYNLYPGSPKALLFTLSVASETKFVEGVLDCAVLSDSSVLQCCDYIPDFCIVGSSDRIPGIKPYKRSEDSARDPFPELAYSLEEQRTVIHLENIGISLGDHAQEIENALLEHVNNDRLYRANHAPSTSTSQSVQVIERRLRIGVHNGYTFVGDPITVHLSSSDEISNGTNSLRRRSKSPRKGRNSIRPSSTFYVRAKVAIPNVFQEKKLTLTFALDYLLGIATNDTTVHDSQSIVVCWGAWMPFGTSHKDRSHVTVELVGGPRPNPEEVLCFKNLIRLFLESHGRLPSVHPTIVLNFDFHADEKRSSTIHPSLREDGTMTEVPRMRENETPERIKQEENRIIREKERKPEPLKEEYPTSDRGDEDDQLLELNEHRLPQIPSSRGGSLRDRERFHDVIDRIVESPRNSDENQTQVILPSTARVSSIPRSIYSAITTAKFPPVRDRHGDTPVVVDIGSTAVVNEAVEVNDRLDTNEIIVQFMAIKWLNKFDNLVGRSVFFTFQFYRFPEITTERLIIDPINQADLRILKRVDASEQILSESNTGFLVRLTVDRSSLLPRKPTEFIDFLNKSSIYMDVWDADSLQIMGTCAVPLKNLLRNGLEAVQTYVQCPIVQSSLPEPPRSTGLLYLRLANIGHPSSNQIDLVSSSNTAIVSRRLQKLGEEGPESYRIRAKPLNPVHESALQRFLHAQRLELSQRYAEAVDQNSNHTYDVRTQNIGKSQHSTRKFIFDEELEAYKKMREESKATRLLEAVFQGITVKHRIFPSLGQSEFFEYFLHNPYQEPINCVVDIEEPGLRVLTNVQQWDFYKRAAGLDTPLETDMFHINNRGMVEVFLKPLDSVYIPLMYDDFKGSNHSDGQVTQTKVIFKRWDSGDPLSILNLHIEHRPFVLNRSFRFIGEEMSDISKQIRIEGVPHDRRVIIARCSDPTVKVNIRNNGVEQNLQFSSFSGTSGSTKSFLILLYGDELEYQQLLVWKITTHAMTRFDIRGIQSQTTKLQLDLNRSGADNQLVQLYSSHSCLQPGGAQPMLITSESGKLPIVFTPEFTGFRLQVLTAVDVSTKDLVGAWLVHANVQQPKITKQFEVNVPIGNDQRIQRKVPIHNPYGIPRTFRLISSRPELVQLESEILEIPAQSSVQAVITFNSVVKKPIGIEVLLFVQNGETGQTEETLSLKISYISD